MTAGSAAPDRAGSLVEVAGLTVRIPTLVPDPASPRRRRSAWVHALTGVDVRLTAGRMLALVGESGCGKSILASTLIGLLPPGSRVSGSLRVAGHDLSAVAADSGHRAWRPVRGRLVGLVPQSSATFLTPTRTVDAQLAETVRALRGPVPAPALLQEAGLERDVAGRYPHELSGGMAGRAAVAFALAGRPPILVADEPTANLDPDRAAHVLALLRRYADEGAAVLLITHDLASLLPEPPPGEVELAQRPEEAVADEVAVMYAGRIVEHGPAGRVLGTPSQAYTHALLAALPRNGLHPVPGMPPSLTDLDPAVRFEDRLAEAVR